MADMGSLLQTFAIFTLISVIVSFVVRISILALILKSFTKKYNISQKYGRAWLAILIPSLIISFLSIPFILAGFQPFSLVISWILFFPILIFSIRFIYKIDLKISTTISLKFFLLILGVVIVFTGVLTLVGTAGSTLERSVPQSVCTTDCEFAYRTDMGGTIESLIVTGYNIPAGRYQEKENYVLIEKTFIKNELDNMERGVNDKILGSLDENNCNFMEFSRGEGETGIQCSKTSKGFFTNMKNILIS